MSLVTAADILKFVLSRGDEATDGTSPFVLDGSMQGALDETWIDLLMEEPWLGLRAYPPQAFITQPAIKTILLTTTKNDPAATLSAIPTGFGVGAVLPQVLPFTFGDQVSIQNWWIMPTGKTYYLRVAAHTAGLTGITLDTVAPETLAAVGCSIAQLEYPLVPGTGVLADALWAEGNGFDGAFVPVRSEEELKLLYPGIPQQEWPPSLAARITPLMLRFSHWDITPHRIEIPYNQELDSPLITDATTIKIPVYLRPALAEAMLAILYEFKKDDRRPLADARYGRAVSKAKDYEMDLKIGQGDQSNQRRGEPYGEGSRVAPYS